MDRVLVAGAVGVIGLFYLILFPFFAFGGGIIGVTVLTALAAVSGYGIYRIGQPEGAPATRQKSNDPTRTPRGLEGNFSNDSRQHELVEVLNDVEPTSWDEIEPHWPTPNARERQAIKKHIQVNRKKRKSEARYSKLKARAERASLVHLDRQVRAVYSKVDDPFQPSSLLIRFCTEEHDLSGSEARRRIAAAMQDQWLTEKGAALVHMFAERHSKGLDGASDRASAPDPIRRQLSKLQAVLDRADCSVPGNEPLFWLLKAECHQLKRERFREAITAEEPETLDDFVSALLDRYGKEWDSYLGWFTELLDEHGIRADEQVVEQRREAIQQEIELDRFEAQLLGDDGPDSRIRALDGMSGEEFEEYLEALFAKMGYSVERTRLVGDQGADLIVSRFGERIVVQAKRYAPHRTVGNDAVQQVTAAMGHYDADRGFVVTTSSFSLAAETLAESNGVELWGREKMMDLLQQYP